MLNNNLALYGAKIIAEIGRDLLFFPVWWYSQGFFLFLKKNIAFITEQEKSLGVMIWIKNIFRPMYGQTDWQGKLISIFIRLVQIIFRTLFLGFWALLSFTALLAWLLFPLYSIYQIFFQLMLN
jgi:hypothetical protein